MNEGQSVGGTLLAQQLLAAAFAIHRVAGARTGRYAPQLHALVANFLGMLKALK